jgi:anti-sigma regulatory factor (Ser/Thr protein kinase)
MVMMAPIRTTGLRPRRIYLRAGPAAAAEARNHVRATIHAWDVPIDPDVAVLLTSELVTNAVRHEGDDNGAILLMLSWAGDQMRVEVHDTSRFEPLLVDAPPDAETGRGLMLVDSLSTDWGFRKTAAGKAVYFTLASEADRPEGDDRDAQDDRNPQGDRRSSARAAARCGLSNARACPVDLEPFPGLHGTRPAN